ncbi:MAG: 4Fe-4S dicluster domain-containing protein [Planctomycetes bacterium]|nr:4Fe-4S dicluster domain-containing protein [Planctomycetota bacterium]
MRIAVALVVVIAFVVAFLTGHVWTTALPSVQAGPAILKTAYQFSLGSLVTVLLIAGTTVIFGRLYCAALCPLGILQDGMAWFFSRKRRIAIPNLSWLRYSIAAVTGILLLGGGALALRMLDPLSNFGGIVGGAGSIAYSGSGRNVLVGVLVPLAAIAILAVWKKRVFCVAVCPVGTVLGLMARYGRYHIHIDEKCLRCGACSRVCPSDCIDVTGKSIDNERCIRCMNCLSACRTASIRFGRDSMARNDTAIDLGKRRFLQRGSMAAAGVMIFGAAAGAPLARMLQPGNDEKCILPPGAGTPDQFSLRCTSCQLCVAVCPTKIIKPALYRYGSVRVDFGMDNICEYGCTECNQVCPTGALQSLTLDEKRLTRIGLASFNARHCRVLQKREHCGFCFHGCPTGAITLRPINGGLEIPQLNPELCIGCGGCQADCPTTPKSMTVLPVGRQTMLG